MSGDGATLEPITIYFHEKKSTSVRLKDKKSLLVKLTGHIWDREYGKYEKRVERIYTGIVEKVDETVMPVKNGGGNKNFCRAYCILEKKNSCWFYSIDIYLGITLRFSQKLDALEETKDSIGCQWIVLSHVRVLGYVIAPYEDLHVLIYDFGGIGLVVRSLGPNVILTQEEAYQGVIDVVGVV